MKIFALENDQPGKHDRRYLLALPVLLTASTGLIFTVGAQWLGKEAGYLLGFAFYWLFWCLFVPFLFLGKEGPGGMLKGQAPLFARRNWPAALLWLVVMVVSIFMYGNVFTSAPLALIAVAIPMATINGICEETLWRGLYVRVFPHNPWMGMIYPAVGFAAWHLAPQIVFPGEELVGFTLSTLFLGLAYGFIAYRSGSAKWTAFSHSLSGILALSGMLAPSLLSLLAH